MNPENLRAPGPPRQCGGQGPWQPLLGLLVPAEPSDEALAADTQQQRAQLRLLDPGKALKKLVNKWQNIKEKEGKG